MSRASEYSLSPKAEARPRFDAYSISDKAYAGVLNMG